MTYATNLELNNIEANFLVIYCFRKLSDGADWASLGGNLYSISWPISNKYPIRAFVDDGRGGIITNESYILVPTINDFGALTGSEIDGLYYDQDTQTLYVKSTRTVTSASIYIDCAYFLSTKDVGWHVIPNNADFPQVKWHGIMESNPNLQSSVNQTIYGFYPTREDSIDVFNKDGMFNDPDESYLSNGIVEIYRWVGELSTDNIQLVFRGFSRNVSYRGESVSLRYVDMSSLLDNIVRRSTTKDSTTASDYGFVFDPNDNGTVDRMILCGKHRFIRAYNTNYSATDSNTVNRRWHLGHNKLNKSGAGYVYELIYLTSVPNAGSNTTTRIYLDSVLGLEVGDWISTANGFSSISAINIGSVYIDLFQALSGALGGGVQVRKTKVRGVVIVHKESKVLYSFAPTDFTLLDIGTFFEPGFQFKTTVEATYSLPENINSERYLIFGNVGGGHHIQFIDGNFLGGASAVTGWNRNPVHAIYEMLWDAGFFDIDKYYDEDSFTTLADAIDVEVNVSSPKEYNSYQPETYRDVISKICESCLIKLYIKNGKWFVSRIEPMGASDHTIESKDIIGNLSLEFNSDEVVGAVKYKYGYQEVDENFEEDPDFWFVANTNNDNADLEGLKFSAKEVESYLYDDDQAEVMSQRFLDIFQRTQGYLKVKLPLSYTGLSLDDTVMVSASGTNFFPYSTDKKFSVVSISEDVDSISVELFDQLGVEASSGDF